LTVDPTERIEYYLQQHSTILSQISQQLASIAPQVSIPSTPPLPFPPFHPSASDIRINTFWFLGLISSLLAAFLALVIQKWVRNNTDVFQRDSDPLKSARLRQYLREGFDQLHLPAVDETIPGLLHLSLFLFFLGLGESLLDINATVGLTTIVPIGFSALIYVFTIFAPIIYPQSPYQNLFSGVIWYLFQKLPGRQNRNRGSWKPPTTNIAEGQMQRAMDETEDRNARDGRAIQWLIDNQTEDADIEKLLMAIPGSFNSEWGLEVWRKISHMIEPRTPFDPPSHYPPTDAMSYPPAPYPPTICPHPGTITEGERIIRELITRYARFLRTLENHSPFTSDDLKRRRKLARAFIGTTATLLFFANARFAWFEDVVDLLGDIGRFEKMRELTLTGTDQLFVTRWSCLSLLAIRRILDNGRKMWDFADEVLYLLSKDEDTGEDDEALTGARTIDKKFRIARQCLHNLSHALPWTGDLKEVKAILRDHESVISELERICVHAGHLENVDQWIFQTQSAIAPQITFQFPGVLDDLDTAQVGLGHFVKMYRDPRQIQFIRPGQTLRSMCSISPTLRNILEGQVDADTYKEMLKDLMEFRSRASNWQGDELQRQLWRLQDLRNGRGFGFTVELFFLGLKQLLRFGSHYALYMGTFRAITRDWKTHKNSIGTQKLLLDIALSRSVDFQSIYPLYVADEFLELLGNIFKGQTGSHIDDAVRQLTSSSHYFYDVFRARLLEVVTRARAQSPGSSRSS
jgi:hypothetical protein